MRNLELPTAARAWSESRAPARILAIRLQALGDIVATLPYLRALQTALPHAAIDFLTRREDEELPRAVRLFRHVDGIGGGRSERRQLMAAPMLVPRLLARRYDVVLDLQNNRVSRAIRRAVAARAWAGFDTHSPASGGDRTRRTMAAAGLGLADVEAAVPLKNPSLGIDVLRAAGRDPSRELVVLSPAGAFQTRNWPIERYARFAHLWQRRRPAQFAILGLPALHEKARALRDSVGQGFLDLVGRTTPSEAFAVVQEAALVVTEDCGLMHMSWVSGVPTLALFGSSRHDWSSPLGGHSLCLHSGDLACGACMSSSCRYGDVHCLTRHSAESVHEHALALVDRAATLRRKTV